MCLAQVKAVDLAHSCKILQDTQEEPKVEEEPEDILGFLRPFYSPIGGPDLFGFLVALSQIILPNMPESHTHAQAVAE